jgi:mevalonate kinase
MRCIGYGKVILLGEHAVVYGYPALAAALPSGVTLEASPGPLSLELPEWGLVVTAEDEAIAGSAATNEATVSSNPESGASTRAFLEASAHPVGRALFAIATEVARASGRTMSELSARLRGCAQIWAGAGLGSSAAMTVAVARALAARAAAAGGAPLDEAALREAASAGERVFHGKPSGLDVALAVSGGAGVFTRATGLVPLALPPLTLVIGHSGAPRSTARMVSQVAERTGGDREDARLRGLAAAAEQGIEAVRTGARAALGEAMQRAHRHLGELGLSTEKLDEMCASAEEEGALGAKLTGAGGGGCAIALVEEDGARVEAAWQKMGLQTRVEKLGS